eukprot:Rhum_TRINITY_DN14636_c0_g1::Rhum_TRINITY_DN14636_c0_g1_i1::g.104632::m.104632
MRASAAAAVSSSADCGGSSSCGRGRSAARRARTAAWAGLLVLVPFILFSGYGGAAEPNPAGGGGGGGTASASAAPTWLQRMRGGPPPVVEAATRCLGSLEGSILFQGGAQMRRVADAVAEVAGLVKKAESGGGADAAYLFRTRTGILAHLPLFAQRDGAGGAATTAAVFTARTLLSEEAAAPHEYVVVHPAIWEPTACKGARYFYLALRKQLAAAKATLRRAANEGNARGPARKRLLVAGLDWEVEARCANMSVAKADGLGLTTCAACMTPEKVAAYRDAMVLAARCAGAEVAVYSETGLEQVKASFRPLAQQTARMEALSMIEALCTPQAQRERRANPHGKGGGGGGGDDDSTASFYEALSCADEEKLLQAWDADKELSTCRCVERLPPPPPPPPPSSSLATAAPASVAPPHSAARAARAAHGGQQRLLVYGGAVEAHRRAVARLNPRLSPVFYEATHSKRVEAGGGALSVVEVEQTVPRRGLTRWAVPPLCTTLAEAFPGAAVEKEEWRVAVAAAAAAATGPGGGADARRRTGGKPVVLAGAALTTRGDNSARDPTPEEVGKYWWRPDRACHVHAFSGPGVRRCLAGVRVAAVGGSELQETLLTLAGLGGLGVALRTNLSDEKPAGVGSFRVGAQQRKAEGYWRAPVGGGGGDGASIPPPSRVHTSLLLDNATRAVDFYWAPSVFSHVGGGPAAAGALRASLRGASAVLLQYGVWDAAHGGAGAGAGVADFYAALSARVAEVQAEVAAGTRVFLVDPRHVWPARCKSRYGARARCHACLAPATTAAYREAVHLAAACAGVPVVSTHDLFRSLPQHTEDGVHYAPSALALEGQLLLNVLCTREHHRPMQAALYEGCREKEALRRWETVEAQSPECGVSRRGGV